MLRCARQAVGCHTGRRLTHDRTGPLRTGSPRKTELSPDDPRQADEAARTGAYPPSMPREEEPSRPATPAPRGCIVAFLVVVTVLVALGLALGLALQPRFPGADPF